MLSLEDAKIAADKLLSQIFHMPIDSLVRVPFKEDDGEGLLLVKRQVGNGQYIYAMYSPTKEDAGISRDFLQVGVVANGKFYFMDTASIPREIKKEFCASAGVVSFTEEYEKASSVEAEHEALKEIREKMPEDEMFAKLRESKCESDVAYIIAARVKFFQSYPNPPVFYDKQDYLSEKDFAEALCGLADIHDVMRKNAKARGEEPFLVHCARKTEELFKNNKLIEDWELSMIDALTECKNEGEQYVMVSFPDFKNGGQTPYYKLSIKTIMTALTLNRSFRETEFWKPMLKVFTDIYEFPNMLGCLNIVSIKCKDKEIYRKNGLEKETEDVER